jgi:hypothetical protein
MALDTITSAVSQEMLASLAMKAIAAEAWEVVRSLRIGSEGAAAEDGVREHPFQGR